MQLLQSNAVAVQENTGNVVGHKIQKVKQDWEIFN